ncbi:MAG: hypothetical protein DIU79_05015 [Actinobacteria bacterium]|nr:MAG: hypothetical protein DIU79_05015 [Actinomycetota bacterium]
MVPGFQQAAVFVERVRHPEPGRSVVPPVAVPRARASRDTADHRANQASLSGATGALSQALAAPAVNRNWRATVSTQLHALRMAFDEHIVLTEGSDGLYAELVGVAPRLARTVQRLARDHTALAAHMALFQSILDSREFNIDQLRECGAELVRELKLHWQHGADLIYEAYATDLGGET